MSRPTPPPGFEPLAPTPPGLPDGFVREDDLKETGLRRSLEQSAGKPPDRAAEVQRLAERMKLPADVVDRNLDTIKKRAETEDTPYRQMLTESPKTAAFASKPENADAVSDQLSHLGLMEWLIAAPVRALAHGQAQVEFGELRYQSMFRDLTAAEQRHLEILRGQMSEGGELGAKTWVGKAIIGAYEQLPVLWGGLKEGSALGAETAVAFGTAAAVAGQLGPQAIAPEEIVTVPAATAIGYIVGQMSGGATYTMRQEAAGAFDEYQQMLDEDGKPMDRNVARVAALTVGALNAGIEVGEIGILLKTIPGVKQVLAAAASGSLRSGVKGLLMKPLVRQALKSLAAEYVTGVAMEAGQEGLQRAVTIIGGELAKTASGQSIEHRTVADMAGDVAGEIGSAAAPFALTLLPGTLLQARQHIAQQKAAQTIVGELNKAIAASKLKDRMPEKLSAFLTASAKDSPLKDVYLPAADIQTFGQDQKMDPGDYMESVTPGGREKYEAAIDAGADVQVPIGDYMMKVASTPHGAFFDKTARFGDPERWSANDAEAFDAKAPDEATPADPKISALDASAQRIYDDLTGQLTGRIFGDRALRAYATFNANVFRAFGSNSGEDPFAIYERHRLTIDRPEVEVPQKYDVQLDTILDRLRDGTATPPEELFGRSLRGFLDDMGGVKDEGGDLASREVDKDRKPYQRNLIQPETGVAMDTAREAAAEAGYLGERDPASPTSIADFLDVLDRELRGDPVYAQGRENADAIEQDEMAQQLGEWLKATGVDLQTSTNTEVKAIIEGERGKAAAAPDPEAKTFDQSAAEPPAAAPAHGPFYSALTRAAQLLPAPTMSADGYLAALRNGPGVTKEERAWSGVEDWLRAKKGQRISRAELVAYLEENEIVVGEVLHEKPPAGERAAARVEDDEEEGEGRFVVLRDGMSLSDRFETRVDAEEWIEEQIQEMLRNYDDDGRYSIESARSEEDDDGDTTTIYRITSDGDELDGDYETRRDAEDAIELYVESDMENEAQSYRDDVYDVDELELEDEDLALEGNAGAPAATARKLFIAPKWATYVEKPGGDTGYRELILTWDPTSAGPAARRVRAAKAALDAAREGYLAIASERPEEIEGQFRGEPSVKDLIAATDKITAASAEHDAAKRAVQAFKHTVHWDEDNPMIHLRFDERMLVNPDTGKPERVMFLEEIQSDWHHQGRKRGYVSDPLKKWDPDELPEGNLLREPSPTYDGDLARLDAVNNLIEELEGVRRDGPRSLDGILRAQFDTTWGDANTNQKAEASAIQAAERERIEEAAPMSRIRELRDEASTLRQRTTRNGSAALPNAWQVWTGNANATATFVYGQPLVEAATREEAIRRAQELRDKKDDPVADAPFRDSWYKTGFRRAVRWAAENGFEAIAWTNGQQQADRYDLSKHIDELHYSTTDEGVTYSLNGYKNGSSVTNKAGIKSKALDAYVGPEVAARIREGAAASIAAPGDPHPAGSGILTTPGLKVGGKWAFKLYDKTIPDVAAQLGKPFGATVSRVPLVEGKSTGTQRVIHFIEGRGFRASTDAGGSDGLGPYKDTRPEVVGWLEANGLTAARFGLTETSPGIWRGVEYDEDHPLHGLFTGPVHHSAREALAWEVEANAPGAAASAPMVHRMAITDKMRDSAAHGFAYFQKFNLEKRGSITFGKNRHFNMSLLAAADLSTFLHESGHFYLEVYGDIVDRLKLQDAPLSPSQLRMIEDYGKLLKWLGVEERSKIEEKHHEMFARGTEAYLREGKAPSLELRGAFNQFKSWLVDIYKSLLQLDVTLTDDVRGVFDRMVASDDQIERAQQAAGVEAMIESQEAADRLGMKPREYALYRETVEKGVQDRKDALEREYLDEYARYQQEWYKARRREVRGEVAAEVHGRRDYIALAFLQKGTLPDGSPLPGALEGAKFDAKILDKRYGKGSRRPGKGSSITNRLLALDVYRRKGGVDPDHIADLFGYSSGDELVQAIVNTRPMDAFIDQVTDDQMEQSYGNMLTDDTAPEKAREAVMTIGRAEVIEAEMKALAKAQRAAKPLVDLGRQKEREANAAARATGIDTYGRFVPTVDAVRAIATRRVSAMAVRDLRPGTYFAASRRASKAATEAALKQDFSEALQQKQRELLNVEMFRATTDAAKDVEKIVSYAKTFDKSDKRERIGRAGSDYLEQIDQLLERFDFSTQTLKAVDKRKSLTNWAAEQQAAGLPVNIPAELLNEARRVNYKDLRVEELRGLRDAVEMIEHMARLKNELLKSKAKRELDAAVADITSSIAGNAGKPPAVILEHRLPQDRARRTVGVFFAAHRKLSSFVRELDGFKDGGAMWDYILRPINEAADEEAVQNNLASKRLETIFERGFKGIESKLYVKQFIPELGGSLSRMGRIMVALNWGNDGNRQRILAGGIGQSGPINESQVEAILEGLTARDWQFVRSTFDYINEFWPAIADKEKRVTGVAPAKVDATPIRTKFGEIPGGYFPIDYEGRATARAASNLESSLADSMKGASYARATTARGHTEARLVNVSMPVRLDFGVIDEHVGQVIHDLTHHEMLIDVGRLLGNRKVQESILTHYGDIGYEQMKGALRDVAVGSTPSTAAWMKPLNYIRQGSVIAGLGWNVVTSALQPFQVMNAAVRIGPKWVLKGMVRWTRNIAAWENTLEWIQANSKFMERRGDTQQREINEIRNQVGLNRGVIVGAMHDALAQIGVDPARMPAVADSFFYFIQKMQQIADIPTWLGAYEKAMDDTSNDETRAFALADQAVIDSQGSGHIKDLSSVERSANTKLLTTFYSYQNMLFNQAYEAVKKTDPKSAASLGRLGVDATMLLFAGSAISWGIHEITTGSGPDGDDPVKALIRQEIADLFGLMMFTRELSGAIQGRPYEGPAGLRGIAQIGRFAVQAAQGVPDPAFWRSLNAVGGTLLHYPATQVQRTVDGAFALMDGRTTNPTALLFGGPRQ